MNDKNLHTAGETEHRSQEKHLTMSKQNDHNTIDKIQCCKHELEIEYIELEEQILALQNVLMGLQGTQQRLEKKVEEQADQLLKVDQEYHGYQNELVNFAKNMIGRLDGERHRLSLDLHDNVAQGLATIKLLLEDKLALLTKDESSSSFSIDSILEITHDNLNEIRRIIDDLRPRMLMTSVCWPLFSGTGKSFRTVDPILDLT